MGWNKISSVHVCNSLSGNAFIIGCYTRRIIGCAVFSEKCDVCTKRASKTRADVEEEEIVLDLTQRFNNKESSRSDDNTSQSTCTSDSNSPE